MARGLGGDGDQGCAYLGRDARDLRVAEAGEAVDLRDGGDAGQQESKGGRGEAEGREVGHVAGR